MTFFRWMMEQIKRDDPVGDLARDMKDDARLNKTTIQTAAEWRKRIKSKASSENVLQALASAVNEYGGLSKNE